MPSLSRKLPFFLFLMISFPSLPVWATNWRVPAHSTGRERSRHPGQLPQNACYRSDEQIRADQFLGLRQNLAGYAAYCVRSNTSERQRVQSTFQRMQIQPRNMLEDARGILNEVMRDNLEGTVRYKNSPVPASTMAVDHLETRHRDRVMYGEFRQMGRTLFCRTNRRILDQTERALNQNPASLPVAAEMPSYYRRCGSSRGPTRSAPMADAGDGATMVAYRIRDVRAWGSHRSAYQSPFRSFQRVPSAHRALQYRPILRHTSAL